MENNIKIKYSKSLSKILNELMNENSYIAFEMLYLEEPDSKYVNGLNISNVDVGKDYYFLVTINKDGTSNEFSMKVGKFLRYYFPGIFTPDEIRSFIIKYNRLKSGKKIEDVGKRVFVNEFEYNPMDIRSTFLSLTTKTYPHGHEEEVLEFLPKDLEKDEFGNYFKIIGSNNAPDTMFTSHLDTADRDQKTTSLYTRQEGGDEIIYTDGNSILGADDKAGVTIMLYMMKNNIPGLYYFFIGEERGGIGSNMLSGAYAAIDYLNNIKRCISFDRRNTNSVITNQLGRNCCSNEFATELCKEYNKSGLNLSLDPTGIYTDSASFIDDIPECTNVSVGYNNEHTGREYQNITFLEKVSKASLTVNWESLPTKRKVGIDQELLRKHRNLINKFKESTFTLDTKIVGMDGRIFIKVDLDESDITLIYDNLVWINNLLIKFKIDADVYPEDSAIKIELK